MQRCAKRRSIVYSITIIIIIIILLERLENMFCENNANN